MTRSLPPVQPLTGGRLQAVQLPAVLVQGMWTKYNDPDFVEVTTAQLQNADTA